MAVGHGLLVIITTFGSVNLARICPVEDLNSIAIMFGSKHQAAGGIEYGSMEAAN